MMVALFVYLEGGGLGELPMLGAGCKRVLEMKEEQGGKTKRKTVVLVDGHAIIHRAFQAVPEELATSKGEVVNARFGFTSILIKALTDIKPDYIAVTFDRPTPTFRHEHYVAYKAHRPTLPQIIRPH